MSKNTYISIVVGESNRNLNQGGADMTQNKTPGLNQNLVEMYRGLVFINWANGTDTKLGAAKYKALVQMQTYAKTIDKNNPVADNINLQMQNMSKSVSKQIMTEKSSNAVLEKSRAPKYKEFGEQLFNHNKKMLDEIIGRGQKSANMNKARAKLDLIKNASGRQDMSMKQNAPQYRATKTNVAQNAPKPLTPHKLSQNEIMQYLWKKQRENVA